MLKETVRVSHFYHWAKLPGALIPDLMAEFAWNGVQYLTFGVHECFRILEDPCFYPSMMWHAHNLGLKFHDVHAPCGVKYDLNIQDPEERVRMFRAHEFCMEQLSVQGATTYTIHVGAAPCYRPDPPDYAELRKLALDTLEKLLPCAKKTGMILCVENSYEPANTPEEVLAFVRYFQDANIQCCFDAGHANFMRKSGKDMTKYSDSFLHRLWRGRPLLDDEIFEKMKPYIVTCHLHDNDGYDDSHILAGDGTADWKKIMTDLETCPLLQSIQNEWESDKIHDSIGKASSVFKNLALQRYGN